MAETAVKNSGSQEIVLRDLESILRKSIGSEVQVVSYPTSLLLPVGENYASTILKVDALIKKNKNAKEENLPLIAKMIPASEFQQSMFDATISFRKEIFVFERLIKIYREIEEEAGVGCDDLIDILPKYYGGRLSRIDDASDVDEDAVLLMENLNVRGFHTKQRMIGLELDHAKMAITELARYHALGMATKQKRPEFFEEAKKQIDAFPFKIVEQEWDVMIHPIIDAISADSRVKKYADRVRTAMLAKKWDAMVYVEAVEPWVTITHGDFWVNNVMFREVNGKPVEVKFVDFQLARFCSPCKDLPYFLCTSTKMEVVENHFDELLDAYHDKFIKTLEKTGCDTSPFLKDKFNSQLKKDAKDEFFRCIMALKVFTLDIPKDAQLNDMSLFVGGVNDVFIERAWRIISKFIEKEWI